MLIIAAVTLVAWVAMALITLYSYQHVFRLEESGERRGGDPPFPRLSVVVAARNEDLGVEQALASLLVLDYPDYEVIFVDDRSDDRTGEIADRLSAGNDRLKGVAICIARASRFRWWTGLALPVASAVIVYSWWRSMIVTLRWGVVWGGPPVPIAELRAAQVRLPARSLRELVEAALAQKPVQRHRRPPRPPQTKGAGRPAQAQNGSPGRRRRPAGSTAR